jgi:hypothetical protein
MTTPNPPGMHRYPVGGSPATWYEIWDGPPANIQAMPELLQPDTPDFPASASRLVRSIASCTSTRISRSPCSRSGR